MAWFISITDILNQWAAAGVFSYVIPFLLIFAVIFAILEKTKILGENRGVAVIIAGAAGLLSLQFDFVSTFFATIFPKFGMAIAVIVVVVILIGLFVGKDNIGEMKWIGYTLAIGVVIWALVTWNFFGDYIGIGWWIEENFWALAIGAILIVAVVIMAKKPSQPKEKAS